MEKFSKSLKKTYSAVLAALWRDDGMFSSATGACGTGTGTAVFGLWHTICKVYDGRPLPEKNIIH